MDRLRRGGDAEDSVSGSGVPVVRALRSLDLRAHRHKGLLDVGRVLGASFQKRDLKLICKFLYTNTDRNSERDVQCK